ncbi:MAG: 50S ribosomal protein L18 [Alphaproteobacteria bacterium]|nr:50S ribosomal protein L18 [Alphaproteobacteria bacterium]
MGKTNPKYRSRQRRKVSIRKRIHGSAARPRLSVFRSANHIYAQVIDDDSGRTLAAASTLSPEFKEHKGHRGNAAAAFEVGKLIAEKAKEANIGQVVFDRNGYLYHGRVKALADGAREGGLQF